MHHPELSLRAGREADANAMADIHNRCWKDAFGHHPTATDEMAAGLKQKALDRFRVWLRDDADVVVIVAELDDVVAGYAAVGGHQLIHLFVEPDLARRGIGRTLLVDAERHISAGGHPIAELHTRVGNDPAIGLYRSAGWLMTDGLLPEEHDGIPYDEHIMVKLLSDERAPSDSTA